MATATQYYYALGRRKSATARVRVQKGKGNITVNGKPAAEYLADSKTLLTDLQRPFAALEIPMTDYDVSAIVSGGGHAGQVEAVRLGIAKALTELNGDYRGTLKRADLLSRDPRE